MISLCASTDCPPTKPRSGLTKRFTLALTEAAHLHRKQLRKGTDVPYISHLLAVASLVLENGGDEDQAIAALLHDAIKDCAEEVGGATLLRDRILELFGTRVLVLVNACTDAKSTPNPPWKERKEAQLRHLQTADPGVLLVVAADNLHHARSLRSDLGTRDPSVWSRSKGGREGTLWYLTAICALLSQRLGGPLATTLVEEVACLQRQSCP